MKKTIPLTVLVLLASIGAWGQRLSRPNVRRVYSSDYQGILAEQIKAADKDLGLSLGQIIVPYGGKQVMLLRCLLRLHEGRFLRFTNHAPMMATHLRKTSRAVGHRVHRRHVHRRHVRAKLWDMEPADTRYAHAQQASKYTKGDAGLTGFVEGELLYSQQQPQQRPTQPEQPTHTVTVRVPPGEAAEIRLVAKELDALQAQIDALVKQKTDAQQRRLQPIILRATAKVIETDPSVNANELLSTPVTPDGEGFSWKVTRPGADTAAASQVPAKPNDKKP